MSDMTSITSLLACSAILLLGNPPCSCQDFLTCGDSASIDPSTRASCHPNCRDAFLASTKRMANLSWRPRIQNECFSRVSTRQDGVTKPTFATPMPVCSEFGDATECAGFMPPGRPTCLTARLQPPRGSDPWYIEIRWHCSLTRPQNAIGYRIRLLDGSSKATQVEVFDIEHRTNSSVVKLLSSHFNSFGCSAGETCVPSQALSENYDGKFIKSASKWNLFVQVITLPFQDANAERLNSSQSACTKVSGIDSCRKLTGCSDQHESLINVCQRTTSATSVSIRQRQSQFCFCVPEKPSCIHLELLSGGGILQVTWGMSDDLLNASLFLFTFAQSNAVYNSTVYANTSRLDEFPSELPACEKTPLRYFRRNFSVSDLIPGDRISVSILPMITHGQRDYDGEGQASMSIRRIKQDTDVAQDSGQRVVITGVVVGLLIPCIAVLAVLMAWRVVQNRKITGKYPHNVLRREEQRILKTVDDFQPLFEIWVEKGVVRLLSTHYRKLHETSNKEEQLHQIILVVESKGAIAFGALLFAFRRRGYDNLVDLLLRQVTGEVRTSVDPVVYPPPPPPPPPPAHGDADERVGVYVSYSRYTNAAATDSQADVMYLCGMLAAHGVDVVVDQYHTTDMAGNVPQWTAEQMERARFVVVVLDNAYPLNLTADASQAVARQLDDSGYDRACLESTYLQGELYRGRRNYVLPVQFGTPSAAGGHQLDVPLLLRGKTRYRLARRFMDDDQQFQLLVLRILGEEMYTRDRAAQFNRLQDGECVSYPTAETGGRYSNGSYP